MICFKDTRMKKNNIAVLMIGTGSPDAPTPEALRRYLKEFLSDRRVVELPRYQWYPILHGIVLRRRPARVAKLYRAVWTPEGAPLLVNARRVAERLNDRFKEDGVTVYPAMCYGRPGIRECIDRLEQDGVDRVLVLPAFPQYTPHTAAGCFDGVFRAYQQKRDIPAIRTVHDYHDAPAYIEALRASVQKAWKENGTPMSVNGKLIISFHSVPQASIDQGDCYVEQCRQTAGLLVAALGLGPDDWLMTFQSKFGSQPWVTPATIDTCKALARAGVPRVDVVCPGFAFDCLETIEEINHELREVYRDNFKPAGEGAAEGVFHYIEALNASDKAVDAYESLIREQLSGWLTA